MKVILDTNRSGLVMARNEQLLFWPAEKFGLWQTMAEQGDYGG